MPEVNNTIVENTTTHIDRIPPRMSVDEQGNVTWTPVYRDHNAAVFHRGKIVTNAEFNELFLKGAYQANYLSDTLKKFFNEHLNAAIFRSFTTGFDIVESFVKPFTTADWGAQQEDGYYYINIPAEEHGFIANDTAEVLERMSIATQMFLLGADDKFYEVSQVEIDTYNNVRLYTDDNTLSGVVIIKMNDKAYTLAGEKIDASFVQGLATVGISGKYTDLVDVDAPEGPNPRLASLENITQSILSGETTVPKAQQANVAERILSTSYIQGIKVSDIFETGSNSVKNATNTSKIQNIDLSANNTAQFGEYTIEKKKLLYRWDNGFSINNTEKQVTKNDVNQTRVYVDYSKIIEIAIAPYESFTSNYRYLRFKLRRVDSTAPLRLVCCTDYADDAFIWYILELNIVNSTRPTRALTAKCQKYEFDTTTGTVTTYGVSTLYLYEIYEIIE